MSWVLRNDRMRHVSVFGAKEYSPDRVAQDSGASKSKKGSSGGGGACRAFVSRMAKQPSMRKANGAMDFAKIMIAWQVENEKKHSGLLEELRPIGFDATEVRRQQRLSGELKSNLQERMSSLGNVHAR